MMKTLKLVALDQEDMEIVSAHLQDAVVTTADIRWRPSERRVVIGLNRFDWEAAHCSTEAGYNRRRAALRFERVSSCQCRSLNAATRNQVVNLLAVSFTETDGPAGVIDLTFSGGAALRLEVECLEVELADLGPVWTTEACPVHAEDGVSQPEGAAKQG